MREYYGGKIGNDGWNVNNGGPDCPLAGPRASGLSRWSGMNIGEWMTDEDRISGASVLSISNRVGSRLFPS